MLIVGYHVAKTGGTTIMHHVIKHMGEEAYFGYGNHPSSDRFFSDLPLWEELNEDERAPVKFLFGHHVNDRILAGLNAKETALFSVIRDPFTHFVSQYKYHLSVIKGEGREVSARTYLNNWKPNRVSTEFYKFFPHLLSDPETPFGEAALFEILKQFQFLCVTEKLTEQSTAITKELGIPPIEGRHRVSKNEVDLEGITKEEVYEKSPLDLKVYEAVLARANGEDSPLNYDEAAFQKSVGRVDQKFKQKRLVRLAYEALAHFFRVNCIIEAAQLHLALRENNENRFAPIIRSSSNQANLRLRKAIARAEKEKAQVYMRHFYLRMARASFEKAITLNPEYVDAYIGYAQCLVRQKDDGGARKAVLHVLEKLDAQNFGAQQLLADLEE